MVGYWAVPCFAPMRFHFLLRREERKWISPLPPQPPSIFNSISQALSTLSHIESMYIRRICVCNNNIGCMWCWLCVGIKCVMLCTYYKIKLTHQHGWRSFLYYCYRGAMQSSLCKFPPPHILQHMGSRVSSPSSSFFSSEYEFNVVSMRRYRDENLVGWAPWARQGIRRIKRLAILLLIFSPLSAFSIQSWSRRAWCGWIRSSRQYVIYNTFTLSASLSRSEKRGRV